MVVGLFVLLFAALWRRPNPTFKSTCPEAGTIKEN